MPPLTIPQIIFVTFKLQIGQVTFFPVIFFGKIKMLHFKPPPNKFLSILSHNKLLLIVY